MERSPDDMQEEGSSLLKKVGCAAAVVGGGTALVGGGIGCATLALGAALTGSAVVCAGGLGAYNYLSDDDNTTEMTVAPAVKYAPNGVLNCREKATVNSGVVETYEPGETVTVDLDRPAQGDWKYTTDNCWAASQLAGVQYLTPIAE